MRAEDVLGRVILVTGKEEFLGARTVEEVRAVVRAHDAESELSEAAASELTLATLGELSAPSLFSSVRCVVVRGLEDLPDESVDGLLGYAAEPAEDVGLVLVHGGGPKGSGVLAKLRKLATVTEVKSGEIKAWEMGGFAVSEARRRGTTLDKQAAEVLVVRSVTTSGHSLPRSTSSPATSPASGSTRRRSVATSGAAPRSRTTRSPTRCSPATGPSRSRSCGGPSRAAPRRSTSCPRSRRSCAPCQPRGAATVTARCRRGR